MKYFNDYRGKLGLCVNFILKIYYNILVWILNLYNVKVFSVQRVDFSNTYYPLLKFQLDEISYVNIKNIVKDSFNSGSDRYRYMHIFTSKGHCIVSFDITSEILLNDDKLYLLCIYIREHCSNCVINVKSIVGLAVNPKSLLGLSYDDFYMYISDKDIEADKVLYELVYYKTNQK